MLAALCLVLMFGSAHAAATVTHVTGSFTYTGVIGPSGGPYGTLKVTSLDAYAVTGASSPVGPGTSSVTITPTGKTAKTQSIDIVIFGVSSAGSGQHLVRTIDVQGFAQDGSCYAFVIEDHLSYNKITLRYGSPQSFCADSGIELRGQTNGTIAYATVV